MELFLFVLMVLCIICGSIFRQVPWVGTGLIILGFGLLAVFAMWIFRIPGAFYYNVRIWLTKFRIIDNVRDQKYELQESKIFWWETVDSAMYFGGTKHATETSKENAYHTLKRKKNGIILDWKYRAGGKRAVVVDEDV